MKVYELEILNGDEEIILWFQTDGEPLVMHDANITIKEIDVGANWPGIDFQIGGLSERA